MRAYLIRIEGSNSGFGTAVIIADSMPKLFKAAMHRVKCSGLDNARLVKIEEIDAGEIIVMGGAK